MYHKLTGLSINVYDDVSVVCYLRIVGIKDHFVNTGDGTCVASV